MFTKQQRSGIFLLLTLIASLQLTYYFIDFSSDPLALNEAQMKEIQLELDSLFIVKAQDKQPKIFPFNPNYITDYKGYTLGMSVMEIDRLHNFRKENKWVNSAREFQTVTKVSDSLLAEISPYFKFPEWVTNKQSNSSYKTSLFSNTPKTYEQKIDLNKASAAQLQKVNGIGEKLSVRIVSYRDRIGGFHADIEIKEVYGLSPEVISGVLDQFTVKSPRPIKRININTATIDELVTVKYIDYEIAHSIIEQRVLREGFQKIEDLTKVKGFPVNKIEIIELYLTFD
ncbi:ComEA family DNA-binding protein [Psychroserpens sp.]|uniref:ComEA family DNA-binding protein n=1 Tax=Psychroserpens sp. TaxID=2020870 RepID=UPI002AA93ACE|nr:helix-hairpin-helix domain-containing protein [Psychroserpens sp.]